MSADTSREAVERLAFHSDLAERPKTAVTLRALLAERDRYAEREAHFAKALGVADNGQYRNDWDAAIRKVLAERDAARAEVARLREALGLGLQMLFAHEPPDSRFVSAEFVALAEVECGIADDAAMSVIRAALAGGKHE